ncbi:MAG TPA: methyltransferase domain-containing protein [Solirubrobacteraceae bacterium]|nr:methyltransferase domain-containing protein [Solirubrobacteraceae bacterium]
MSETAPYVAPEQPEDRAGTSSAGMVNQACPICHSERFIEFAGRAGARCEVCDALERHRALARQMSELLHDGADRGALEAGPASPRVFGDFLRERGWRYQSVDQSRHGNPNDPRAVGFIDHEADLCDLSIFPDDAMHLVIVQHVIEEIPAYEKALAELARVLAPGGTALLEIPFNPTLARSERHQPNHFGNVWRFGADLPDRMAEHFSDVSIVELQEAGYYGRLLVCRHTA